MNKSICIFALILIGAVAVFSQQKKAFFYQQLAWSPDGKTLSFTAMSDYDEKTDEYRTGVFIFDLKSSRLKKISGNANHAFFSAWSPDGKRIFFGADTDEEKESNIFSVKKDGSDLIQLTRDSGKNTAPSLSPDGKKIAFMSARNGEKYQIYIMNSDGSNLKKMTTDPNISFCNPVWSKDGKRIVYYSDKGDRKDQIWIMNADGSDQKLLTNNTGHNIFPSFSPDGKRIIFSRRDDKDADQSYVDASFLFTINADGSNLEKLSGINSFFARFSPDGKRIAFVSGKFPANAIYIAEANGSNVKKITAEN